MVDLLPAYLANDPIGCTAADRLVVPATPRMAGPEAVGVLSLETSGVWIWITFIAAGRCPRSALKGLRRKNALWGSLSPGVERLG